MIDKASIPIKEQLLSIAVNCYNIDYNASIPIKEQLLCRVNSERTQDLICFNSYKGTIVMMKNDTPTDFKL